MKISLNWLKEFIKISENPQKIEAILTETGLEVDEVINNLHSKIDLEHIFLV